MSYLVVGPCVLGGVLPLLSLSCIQDNSCGPPQIKQISIRISASLRHVNFAMVGQPARCDSQTILRGFQQFYSQLQFRAAPVIISSGWCWCTKRKLTADDRSQSLVMFRLCRFTGFSLNLNSFSKRYSLPHTMFKNNLTFFAGIYIFFNVDRCELLAHQLYGLF